MLQSTVDHFLTNAIPAARDYNDAEVELTAAWRAAESDHSKCQVECDTAKRRAAEVAVALDGLADRAARALNSSPNAIRARVALLSAINGVLRPGCVDRVCAVANAYKHDVLTDPKHPIRADADILVVGAGYGVDGFGIGKYSGIEVMVRQTDGRQCKFLGDVPYSVAGWCTFLKQQGATLPFGSISICGLPVN